MISSSDATERSSRRELMHGPGEEWNHHTKPNHRRQCGKNDLSAVLDRIQRFRHTLKAPCHTQKQSNGLPQNFKFLAKNVGSLSGHGTLILSSQASPKSKAQQLPHDCAAADTGGLYHSFITRASSSPRVSRCPKKECEPKCKRTVSSLRMRSSTTPDEPGLPHAPHFRRRMPREH